MAIKQVAIFGLGEAGSLFAKDLVEKQLTVVAYDPADVTTPAGVKRVTTPEQAVTSAELILALTASQDAPTALKQAIAAIPKSALYADLSSSSAQQKRELAELAAVQGFSFTDVALMSTVPGKGLYTPALASGSGAEHYVTLLSALGVPITQLDAPAGAAAMRKLLRSVMMKGLAALVIEAMRAAEQAGCSDWLWQNLSEQITTADEALLARLVRGTKPHALRRLHEMQASKELLEELGVDPVMTTATVESLQAMLEASLPGIPEISNPDDNK